jgi:prevent-host-death family protein
MYIMYMSESDPLSVAQAREQFPSLLEAAEAGVQSVITRRGRPVAVLGPLDQRRPRHKISLDSLIGSGAGLWGKSAGEHVAGLRGEWAP